MGRESTASLGKPSKPYSQISDGKKTKVKGQANVPTKRQKTGMASLAASVVGGVYGKPIAILAKNLSKPLLEKALQPLTGTKTGPSKQSIKDQLKRVREIADKEKSGELPSKKLKDNKTESFIPKGMSRRQQNPTTSRASEKGTGKRVGYSKKMERTGKTLGRAERAIGGSGMGAVPMSATAKDKPKLAPRPKSKPAPKTKNKDTKEYGTTRRGLSGRNVQIPSNKKNANVIVDIDAVSKKSTGGLLSKSKNSSFLNKGYGKALKGF